MMDYFWLKLGKGNSLASNWLSGNNPLQNPAAVIYFDNKTVEDYAEENGRGVSKEKWNKVVQEFIRRSHPPLCNHTRFVVIHQSELILLKPAGRVVSLKEEELEGKLHTPKAMPVDIMQRHRCRNIPAVLAGMGANQYYSQNTFVQIKDWGNLKALDCVHGIEPSNDHWNTTKQGVAELLKCLGSTQLETLVAKIFEARGCFVPAHHGGTLKDVDLIAYNDTERLISVGNREIPARKSLTLQVKRHEKLQKITPGVDLLVYLGKSGATQIGADELLALAKESDAVKAWLKRSLDWLPSDYLKLHFM